MRILHLASGNRWTGAAAPAFAEVEALRGAGIDAHYAYVGGYKLEKKIGHHDFAHPLIDRSQNPVSFGRTIARIDRLVRRHGFDVIHAHLSWDHWLARFVARANDVRIARTFHSRRALRSDVLTRSLLKRTDHLFIVNDAFRDAGPLHDRRVTFTPPPVDHEQFTPKGADVRAAHGIGDAKLLTVIGKLAKGRGFEAAIETFAIVRSSIVRHSIDARLMIIGHGEHRPALEALTRSLGVADATIWAGYHEEDLADHYRASDLLLFTAKGSDEGHRAILEAMACGVPPACYPIEGVLALTGPDHLAAASTPAALAACATSLLVRDRARLGRDMWQQSLELGYAKAAERLVQAYRNTEHRTMNAER